MKFLEMDADGERPASPILAGKLLALPRRGRRLGESSFGGHEVHIGQCDSKFDAYFWKKQLAPGSLQQAMTQKSDFGDLCIKIAYSPRPVELSRINSLDAVKCQLSPVPDSPHKDKDEKDLRAPIVLLSWQFNSWRADSSLRR